MLLAAGIDETHDNYVVYECFDTILIRILMMILTTILMLILMMMILMMVGAGTCILPKFLAAAVNTFSTYG